MTTCSFLSNPVKVTVDSALNYTFWCPFFLTACYTPCIYSYIWQAYYNYYYVLIAHVWILRWIVFCNEWYRNKITKRIIQIFCVSEYRMTRSRAALYYLLYSGLIDANLVCTSMEAQEGRYQFVCWLWDSRLIVLHPRWVHLMLLNPGGTQILSGITHSQCTQKLNSTQSHGPLVNSPYY